jgi:hypothetical protein
MNKTRGQKSHASVPLKVEPGKSEESARILQESSLLLDLKGQSVQDFLTSFFHGSTLYGSHNLRLRRFQYF